MKRNKSSDELDSTDKLSISLKTGVDLSSRTIVLDEEITTASFRKVEMAMTSMEKESNEDITIKIMSPGGDFYSGMAIINRILASNCKIITEAYGIAASMAFCILASGKERKMSSYCIALFHTISYQTDGNLHEVKREQEQTEQEFNFMCELLASKSKKSKKFWYNLSKQGDVTFTSEALKRIGIIDKII